MDHFERGQEKDKENKNQKKKKHAGYKNPDTAASHRPLRRYSCRKLDWASKNEK